jgi:hypothetical protein
MQAKGCDWRDKVLLRLWMRIQAGCAAPPPERGTERSSLGPAGTGRDWSRWMESFFAE